MFQQVLVSGIMVSAIYALLALGFSLVYGAARIVNLTHTAFFMLAAYFMFTFFQLNGMNVILAIALTLILTTAIGLIIYRLFVDRIREHEEAVFMITIALALIIQEIILLFYGADFRGIDAFVPGYSDIFGVRVSNQHLITLGVVSAVIALVAVFLYWTSLGLAIRVTAQSREIANLVGINVGMICLMAVGIGTALATLGGVMVAPIYAIEPRMWTHPLITVLAIVILGGLGSIKGSIIGALIIGMVESIVVNLFPMGSFIKGAVALSVMVLVLLLRPEGLFGISFEEERL